MSYKLLTDLGNTRLKWARLSDGVLEPAAGAVHTNKVLARVLHDAWQDMPAPASVWVASVASDALESELHQWCQKQWPAVAVHFPRTIAQGYGVTCAYPHPRRMGVDRWLALVAARQLATTPACVVDIGTAVTLDALDSRGNHLGGLILPGISAAQELLSARTGRLRLQEKPGGRVARASNTEDAVYSGSYWAIVALIERFMEDLQTELRQSVSLFLTGGDAGVVQESLGGESRLEPDLVLKGLELISA